MHPRWDSNSGLFSSMSLSVGFISYFFLPAKAQCSFCQVCPVDSLILGTLSSLSLMFSDDLLDGGAIGWPADTLNMINFQSTRLRCFYSGYEDQTSTNPLSKRIRIMPWAAPSSMLSSFNNYLWCLPNNNNYYLV